MSGMITKPPPNESAPTLRAVQASAPRPPWATTATGAMTGRRGAGPPWRGTRSTPPPPARGPERDGGNGRAGPGARALDPQRRGLPEQDGRQSDHGDDRRDDEAQA